MVVWRYLAAPPFIHLEAGFRQGIEGSPLLSEERVVATSVPLLEGACIELRDKPQRPGRNPKTGAMLEIPASVTPKFSAGATFKARVKAGK